MMRLMPSTAWYVLTAAAYLVGAVPVGLLIGRAKGVDIRRAGSGNIGATNAGRVLGRTWGLICFALDVLKGLVPVLAAGWWFGWLGGEAAMSPAAAAQWLGVGVAAILGHVFPIYLKFSGGKGVATSFGAILGVWPWLTLPALGAAATWLLFAGALRYVGLASVTASVLLPGFYLLAAASAGWPLGATWPFPAVAGLMAVLVIARHRGNLVRLRRGTESKLGESRGFARPRRV